MLYEEKTKETCKKENLKNTCRTVWRLVYGKINTKATCTPTVNMELQRGQCFYNYCLHFY